MGFFQKISFWLSVDIDLFGEKNILEEHFYAELQKFSEVIIKCLPTLIGKDVPTNIKD
ncbi:hypothetical protein [Chryseobacterium lacus]|uniref:hypothetical protein n=1 Tax=Chryseobacterium lacus TaxID=2058346 RepID=UPI00140DD292|nr:hypothetical protein [Chryseobacterium lacus]